MKKVLIALLCLILAAGLTGCGKSETPAPENTQQPAAADSAAASAGWYELSAENTVLTVRLPDDGSDALRWNFEISNPELLELITHETAGGAYVGSFMSPAGTPGTVSLILKYAAEGEEIPQLTNVLELNTAGDKTISVASELVRTPGAEWFSLSDDGKKLTVRLETAITEGLSWSASVTDSEILTMSASSYDPETALFTTEYTPVMTKPGQVEVNLAYGNKTEGTVLKSYTVNLLVSETGEMTIKWSETFQVGGADSQSLPRNI